MVTKNVISRNQMVLALINDEMNMVRGMSMDEVDVYIESLLTRIISRLSDSEVNDRYNLLENV